MSQPPNYPQGNPDQPWNGQQGGHPQQGFGPHNGNPQQGFNPQGGFPQQGYPQQAPPKKKGGCMKVGLVVLGIFVVLGIIIAAAGGGEEDDSPTVTSGENSAQESSTDGNAGNGDSSESKITFKGTTDKDTVANGGDSITKDGVTTTSSPLAAETTILGNTVLCTTIIIKNDGDNPVNFNTVDWKMQDPNGAAKMTTYGGDRADLSFGDLAPGGQTSGDLCFDGNPAQLPGEYVVLNDGFISLSSARLAWVNQL